MSPVSEGVPETGREEVWISPGPEQAMVRAGDELRSGGHASKVGVSS
ncbi:hypothetical protein [Labrenzia sp. OB1]|nr:hypothetical protein [Labrenzia sp. OB1]